MASAFTDEAGLGSEDALASDTSVSHSREKNNLCCEIILDHFGPVAAQVASTLLQRGRLTLRDLSRFLATPTLHAPTGYIPEQDDVSAAPAAQHGRSEGAASAAGGQSMASTSATMWTTPLRSQRLIQQTLITLIQHNVCWHACLLPDGTLIQAGENSTLDADDGTRGVEYFQINVDEVISRLRFGSYLEMAVNRFGEIGMAVVEEILHQGKLRVSELIERTAKRGFEVEDLQDVVRDMLFYAYLQPSHVKAHTSPRDRRIAYEAEEVLKIRKILTKKEKLNISTAARQRLLDDDRKIWFAPQRDDYNARRGLIPAKASKGSKKRRAPAVNGNGTELNGRHEPATKKRKSNGRAAHVDIDPYDIDGFSDHDEQDGPNPRNYMADPKEFIRLNFDRFDVHLRDEVIVHAIERRHNAQLAGLVDAMLQTNKGDYDTIPHTREPHSHAISTSSLLHKLPKDLRFKGLFNRQAIRDKLGSDKASSESALLGEALAVLLRQGDESPERSSKRFLSPTADSDSKGLGGSSKVQIEYRNAARMIRRELLRKVVKAQFKEYGVRILTLLIEMGKLDEKHISKVCFMSMNDTRDLCSRMFAAGLLTLQEVPKASDRSVMRNFYLWYVDERNCTAWLSDRLCKTLSRLTQRRRQESAREAELLARVNRFGMHHPQDEHSGENGSGGVEESMLRNVDARRLARVRQTVDTFALAELRTWKDLFVVANLPE